MIKDKRTKAMISKILNNPRPFILAVFIFVSLLFGGFPSEKAHAYFSGSQETPAVFSAGTVKFDLVKSNIDFNVMGSGSTDVRFIYSGTLGFKYSISAGNSVGNLCPEVSIQIAKNGEVVYTGPLKEDFVTDSESGSNWTFTLSAPDTYEPPTDCNFNLIFRAWQADMPIFGSGGFDHEDEVNLRISSRLSSLKNVSSGGSDANSVVVATPDSVNQSDIESGTGTTTVDVDIAEKSTTTEDILLVSEVEAVSSESQSAEEPVETVRRAEVLKIKTNSSSEPPREPSNEPITIFTGETLKFSGIDSRLVPMSLWKDGEHLRGLGIIITGDDAFYWEVPAEVLPGRYEIHIDKTVNREDIISIPIIVAESGDNGENDLLVNNHSTSDYKGQIHSIDSEMSDNGHIEFENIAESGTLITDNVLE